MLKRNDVFIKKDVFDAHIRNLEKYYIDLNNKEQGYGYSLYNCEIKPQTIIWGKEERIDIKFILMYYNSILNTLNTLDPDIEVWDLMRDTYHKINIVKVVLYEKQLGVI